MIEVTLVDFHMLSVTFLNLCSPSATLVNPPALSSTFVHSRPLPVSIAKRASDVMTPIFLKHFLKLTVFLKHIFETKTSPGSPLVLSEYADVV